MAQGQGRENKEVEERIKQHKQNRMFNVDQKRVYKEFNRESSNERVISDAEESTRFCRRYGTILTEGI